MQDTRPKWDFRAMTEVDFRRMYQRARIVSVKAEWEFTGADTSREWLTAQDSDGKTFTVPKTWREAFSFVGGASNPGLFRLNHTGSRMAERIKEIDAWERQNKKERTEYERLRQKFGDAV